jgi:tubulin--tyrosine ligase
MRFHFNERELPTQANLAKQFNRLGIYYTHEPNDAAISDNALEQNDKLLCLEDKWSLSTLLSESHYYPETLLCGGKRTLSLKEQAMLKEYPYWIVKPRIQNNGQGIRVMRSEHLLQMIANRRLDAQFIFQRYLERPLLLSQRKFSIRLLLVLTDIGQVYLYRSAYLNLARERYLKDNLEALPSHITNEHLVRSGKGQQQILDSSTQDFWCFLKAKMILNDLLSLFQKQSNYARKCSQPSKYSFWGMDFMFDEQEKLWLLEANFGPCFPTSSLHPLYQSYYQPFWQEVANIMLGRQFRQEGLFDCWDLL